MLNFFQSIIEYLQLTWTFFLNLVTSLVTAFYSLLGSVSMAISITTYMPWFLGTSFFSVVSIIIINYIIGRSNQ